MDREFAKALDWTAATRVSQARQGERKTRQFCRQVQRALNLALADRHDNDGLNELFVEDVTPAPDAGHLLVHVVIPANRPVAEALSALRRDTPRLRSEVAAATTRKRTPELSFAPVYAGLDPQLDPALDPELNGDVSPDTDADADLNADPEGGGDA